MATDDLPQPPKAERPGHPFDLTDNQWDPEPDSRAAAPDLRSYIIGIVVATVLFRGTLMFITAVRAGNIKPGFEWAGILIVVPLLCAVGFTAHSFGRLTGLFERRNREIHVPGSEPSVQRRVIHIVLLLGLGLGCFLVTSVLLSMLLVCGLSQK
jgi:hypothetical protein